jgi:hypothetical protein
MLHFVLVRHKVNDRAAPGKTKVNEIASNALAHIGANIR